MAEIGRWNGRKFEVSPDVILGFTGLTVKGSSETEEKTSSNQKYVSRKNGKPTEVNVTVHLNAQLGCDVRKEAMAFVDQACAGNKDYFYVGNAKLVTCQLMLTDASVEEVEIAGGGTWTRANVKLTLKQCTKNDGTTGGSSGGGAGISGSKKTSVTTASVAGAITGAVSGLVYDGPVAKLFIAQTVKAAQSVSTAAKATSATKKPTTTSKNCVITTQKITRVGASPKINLNIK